MFEFFKPIDKAKLISIVLVCFFSGNFCVNACVTFEKNDIDRMLLRRNSCEKKDDIGPMLHVWCWRFSQIKDQLGKIESCGYKSIQVSPLQNCKETLDEIDGQKTWSTWWSLYQPLNFKIGNCLGTEEEFKAMCEEAHKFGIKVIVDVVINHLAEGNQKGSYSKDIDEELLKMGTSNLFHENGISRENSRYDLTQADQGGLPDLNTANIELQEKIKKFLLDVLECGADGFRFDAAKHIELPYEENFGSSFWPEIIGAILEKKPDAYLYGETLRDDLTDFGEYIKFMNITDSYMSDSIAECLRERNVHYIRIDYTPQGYAPENFVTWVESHDNFTHLNTAFLRSEDIILGWAIIAGRRNAVPLFFVRPKDYYFEDQELVADSFMGDFVDSLWQQKIITKINQFRLFAGNSKEYILRFGQSICAIVRQNVGVVIVNLSNKKTKVEVNVDPWEESVLIKNRQISDIISQGIFAIKNSKLMVDVAARSVSVLYLKSVPVLSVFRKIGHKSIIIDTGFNYIENELNLLICPEPNVKFEVEINGEKIDLSDGNGILICALCEGQKDLVTIKSYKGEFEFVRRFLFEQGEKIIPTRKSLLSEGFFQKGAFRVELINCSWQEAYIYLYPANEEERHPTFFGVRNWPGRKMRKEGEKSIFSFGDNPKNVWRFLLSDRGDSRTQIPPLFYAGEILRAGETKIVDGQKREIKVKK